MAHVELNVASGVACENTARQQDGAYVCNVHNLLGSNIKRTRVAMGQHNPHEEPIDELVRELQGRVRDAYKFLGHRVPPIDSFVGLSILRVCVRASHIDEDDISPRVERVASVIFGKNPEAVFEIVPHRLVQMRSISEAGIGSARRVEGGTSDVSPLLHLPITPEERDYSQYAVAAFPATGKARDPHVVKHMLPDDSGSIEQIVWRDALSG